MKAYSLYAVNDLHYENKEYPECPLNWAIIRVKAAGICSSDIQRVFINGTYHFPTVIGHEFSGIVDKVGNINDKKLIGKRVGVFPLIPCKKCLQCQAGHYEMCSSYDYIGSRRDGGFAEYVAVPIWNLIELPDEISFKEAAMMEPLSVALHAIKFCKIKSNHTVAIIGTGMIGFAAAQWALELGAKNVTVLGRGEAKRIIADNLPGIKYLSIESCSEEYDVILEAVGSNNSINKAINIAKPAGSIVFIGNPVGNININQNTYWRILRKQLKIIGSWNSSYEKDMECDWSETKNALATHKIKALPLISHIFDKDNLRDGLNLMYNHKEPYCKVMTLW